MFYGLKMTRKTKIFNNNSVGQCNFQNKKIHIDTHRWSRYYYFRHTLTLSILKWIRFVNTCGRNVDIFVCVAKDRKDPPFFYFEHSQSGNFKELGNKSSLELKVNNDANLKNKDRIEIKI